MKKKIVQKKGWVKNLFFWRLIFNSIPLQKGSEEEKWEQCKKILSEKLTQKCKGLNILRVT